MRGAVIDRELILTVVSTDIRLSQQAADFRREALRVGLLSLGLAVLLELLQIAVASTAGGDYGPSRAARDTLLKLPWAVIVCLSLWTAITLGAGRPTTIALVGLIAAPVASLFARAGAELAHAYAATAAPVPGPPALLVAGLKGLEYACLGLVLIWLRRRGWSALQHHAGAGFLIGLLFGGLLLIVTLRLTSEPFTNAAVGAWAINEVLFPTGCALILGRAARV